MLAQGTLSSQQAANLPCISSFRTSRKVSRCSFSAQTSRRAGLTVCASQKATNNDLQRGVERFFQKYDVTSAGVGALTVTSFCVWRGQDPATALSITLAATVAALVINEYIFEDKH